MLMPKKVKHRKQHRGRTKGVSKGATEVTYGDYGIQALEPGWLTARQIEAGRIAWETEGVTTVEDELTVAEDSGTNAYLTDVRISNTLRFALLTDIKVSSVNYNVETIDRVVHLTGLAKSNEELGRVIARAQKVAGVERVVSHVLTIDDPRRVSAVAVDS